MAANRSPQTQEKRRREREKQEKRQEKMARKLERNAAKREARRDGTIESVVTGELSRDPLVAGQIIINPAVKPQEKQP